MKIGIMLRHYDQHGGGVLGYTHNLIREILAIDGGKNEYVLIYQSPKLIGTYDSYSNVKEVSVEIFSKFLWDQLAVRKIEKQEKLDVIFNPKYSLPFLAKCKTVFVCHGLDWYVMPWGSKWIDRLSHKYLIPQYAKKADAIIAVSNTPRDHLIEFLDVPPEKAHTVYLGVNEAFSAPISDTKLAEVKSKYKLPEHFFLYVGQIYPPKNFARLLKAYAKVGPELGIHLVVAGEHRWLCGEDLDLIDKLNIHDWVIQTGWIGHDVLPSFYRLADTLLLPSLYEACPSPILEAMASRCPFVTANRYGTKELAGNAGTLVDPEDIDSIAAGMRKSIENNEVRAELIEAGLKRVKEFSWEKCAEETLKILENLGDSH